jgi:hypothetical protein
VPDLRPLPFHEALARTLSQTEPGLWSWFASDDYGKKYAENLKLELLRSTYRLPVEAHERTYALAREAALALGVEVPVTLYQAPSDGRLNAGLAFVPAEAHVVLNGPVLELLSEAELRALFGHELAHHVLWTRDGGRYHVACELIEHIVRQPGFQPSHAASALRHRRWTELFADRGSLVACEDLAAAVSCLMKVTTGLKDVDPRAYLDQAREVLSASASDRGSEGVTHPESFLRAHALEVWHAGGDDSRLRPLIDGALELETLDLVQQHELTRATRELVAAVLAPKWMRTEATLLHARRFFPEASFEQAPAAPPSLLTGGPSVADYYGYLLLDFAMSDPELEDQALAHVAHLGTGLGLGESLPKLVRKELRLSAASWAELEKKGAQLAATPAPSGDGA